MRSKGIILLGSKFIVGGSAYGGIEILWRGFTHISMIILGGLCFLGLLRISQYKLNLVSKSVAGGGMITVAELLAGIILNIWLSLDVWDYSDQRFQLLGQVSLKYFVLWCGLSFVVVAGYKLVGVLLKMRRTSNA